ncbi:MAG TPA: multicopper oxidase domain-containing protein [Candidatus Baltobacteraceae bacterium]|jgi:FtsP/CotA-like multicopper oxidase with cupredoxin domain
MNRRRFVVVAAAAGVSAAAVAACSGRFGGPVSELEPLVTGRASGRKYSVTVKYATTSIDGKIFRTRTYDGHIPGPTLVTRTGELLDVTIVNKLPRNPKAPCPKGPMRAPAIHDEMEDAEPNPRHYRMATGPIDCMNNPHDFNTTNLHTHGIQTIPHLFEPLGTSNPAAPMLGIEPGHQFHFPLPVPQNHPSGLHWYHPHHHGSTDVQVSNGMAGLIVVRGPIDAVPEIAAARELFLVIQSLQVNKGKKTNHYDLEPIAYKPRNEGGYYVDTDYTMFTVSTDGSEGRTDARGVMWEDASVYGKKTYEPVLPTPTFTMQPGEIIRLRLLNGCNQHALPLVLVNDTTGATMDVRQIAFDGVNLKAPKKIDMSGKLGLLGGLTVKNFIDAPVRMTVPGNRIEFLIQAPNTPGTYTLSSLKADDLHGPGTKIAFMTFVVAGTPKAMEFPKSLPLPEREYPFIEKPSAEGKTFEFSFKGDSNTILTGFDFLVNGVHYMEEVCPTTVKLGDTVEWRIENATGSIHPFHLHVNSFWLVAINDKVLDEPEIWDTFYVPPKRSRDDGKNGSITIRVRWLQWRGKTVHHCHFLSHEDTGMMQNFLIQ